MRNILLSQLLLLIFPLVGWADQKEEIKWPPEIEATFRELREIKRDALKVEIERTDRKKLRAFQVGIEKLRKQLITHDLEGEVWRVDESSLEEKFALWALDKTKRSKLYERIWAFYVVPPRSRSVGEDDLVSEFPGHEEFAAKLVALDQGPVNRLDSIQEKDKIESSRLAFEYFLYSYDREFTPYEDYKPYIAGALMEIGNKKSVPLFFEVSKEILEANNWARENSSRKDRRYLYIQMNLGLSGLYGFASEETFPLVSKVWEMGGREQIKTGLGSIFGDEPTFSKKRHALREKWYEKWQALANKDWEQAAEKELSSWIKQQKVPPLRVPPPTDPDCPFGIVTDE